MRACYFPIWKFQHILSFFTRLEEELTGAFARSSRVLKEANDPSAKQTRGSARRHYLHEALLTVAKDVQLPTAVGWTDPATWSFPVITIGGFTLTIGIVESKFRGAGRRLRTRSKYVEKLCERNGPLDPQGGLFEQASEDSRLLPDGALGALIVAEYKANQPDVPAFLGFWVPSESLSSTYYVRSFDQVITMIRDRLSIVRKPAKRVVTRKPVRLRKPKDGGKK